MPAWYHYGMGPQTPPRRSASIRLPPDLIDDLDRIAEDRACSRNSIVTQACRAYVADHPTREDRRGSPRR